MFARLLTERMQEMEMSTEDIAERMGLAGCKVSRQSVSYWVNGHALPRVDRLSVLCDVLRMSREERGRLVDASRISA